MDTTQYRLAPSGEGPHAATWKDKPHRLVYDLCSEVENLQGRLEIAEINQKRYADLYRGEGNYPKLLVHTSKYGDRHILILDEDGECEAWLAMFNVFEKWENFYVNLEGKEKEAYSAAAGGDWKAAKWLLDVRNNHEYEHVDIVWIYTPYSLNKRVLK